MRIALATSLAELPPSDRALAHALTEHGAEPRSALWHSPHIDWSRFNAVAVRSCWDYHLQPDAFLDWISQLETLGIPIVNPPALIRWNFRKTYLDELARRGVRIPETVWLAPGQSADVAELCRARGWRATVIKPLISASAYRTERRREGTVHGPAMIQEYLDAIEIEGEWSLIYMGGRFSHAVRKRPSRGDFRVQMEFGGAALPAAPDAALLAFAESALRALPEPGVLVRVDVVQERRGCFLMELEAIEPELFLSAAPGSAHVAAGALLAALESVLWAAGGRTG